MHKSITTVPALIAVCDRCGERSDPIDPEKIERWVLEHQFFHEREDLKDRASELGHKITIIREWMIEDDGSLYASCSCKAWRSRSAKADMFPIAEGNKHLADVVAQHEQSQPAPLTT